jgi:hypothetical protein
MKFHPQGTSSPLAAWWAAVVATAGGAVKKKQDHGADEEETMTIASNTSFDSPERDGSEDPANRGGEKKKGLLAGRFQGMPTSMRSVCTMLVTKLSISSSSKSKTTKANKNKPTTIIIKKRRQDIAEFYV